MVGIYNIALNHGHDHICMDQASNALVIDETTEGWRLNIFLQTWYFWQRVVDNKFARECQLLLVMIWPDMLVSPLLSWGLLTDCLSKWQLGVFQYHIDGLVQDCSNSIANALELLQSCTKPSIWTWKLTSIENSIVEKRLVVISSQFLQ